MQGLDAYIARADEIPFLIHRNLTRNVHGPGRLRHNVDLGKVLAPIRQGWRVGEFFVHLASPQSSSPPTGQLHAGCLQTFSPFSSAMMKTSRSEI
jgi:hypothetical protein